MEHDNTQEASPQQTGEVYTFSKPVLFEGETYDSITLDFDRLNGDDILSCDRQYRNEQKGQVGVSLAPEMEKAYQAYIAAKAAGVHVGLIRAASGRDFTRLTLRARNFLLL